MADPILLTRDGVDYRQRPDGSLYCDPIDQSGMVGGTTEMQRNAQHNPDRLARIQAINPNATVLDYGCGNGLLVNCLLASGINTTGYDKYNPQYSFTPVETYDIVTMVEVIEHTCAPYSEIDDIYQYLKPGGTLIIETSFVDWMDTEDAYINPAIGHQTIFSHAGLNNLLIAKGFEVGEHINWNVRVYHKPLPLAGEKAKITLITMGQGNVKALKQTFDSFKDVVDEFVYGDLLIFPEDRETVERYKKEYNLKVVPLPFNYIFINGFSAVLNVLSQCASNDWVLYMNTSEVIDGDAPDLRVITPLFNCYHFNHKTDPHHWYRLYNRAELYWSGLIHEQVIPIDSSGGLRPYPFPVFTMKDTEKDMDSPFKAAVFNSLKEAVYFNQYIKLIEQPESIAVTNIGWVNWAAEQYDSMKKRLQEKGRQYEALQVGDLEMFIEEINTSDYFLKERFESSDLINYQGARKDIL